MQLRSSGSGKLPPGYVSPRVIVLSSKNGRPDFPAFRGLTYTRILITLTQKHYSFKCFSTLIHAKKEGPPTKTPARYSLVAFRPRRPFFFLLSFPENTSLAVMTPELFPSSLHINRTVGAALEGRRLTAVSPHRLVNLFELSSGRGQ